MVYQETRDDIVKTLGSMPGFLEAVPRDVLVQMWPAAKSYFVGQSRIPAKYREMISLGVSMALKCAYCEAYHMTASKLNGATDEELAELGMLVSQVTFWSAMTPGMNYDMASFMREFQAMAERFGKRPGDSLKPE